MLVQQEGASQGEAELVFQAEQLQGRENSSGSRSGWLQAPSVVDSAFLAIHVRRRGLK